MPADWVRENIRLPPEKTETEPGPVSFDSRPYLVDPLNDLADPEVETVVWVAPTRMGKTFLLRMAFAYFVAVIRLPLLWYDSIVSKARSVSQKEIQPLIYYNKVLRDRLPANRHHTTNTKILFPGAPFEMFGANSVSQAAGETAALVLGNEVDKWAEKTEKEAATVELVKHRTESFNDERKHFLSSTPTVESGAIWLEYLAGDQRRFYVPCKKCGYRQQLIWDQVKWNPAAKNEKNDWDLEEVRKSARYQCENESCGELHTQSDLRKIIKRGEWRPTAEGAPGVRSYQVNGLYGPLKVNRMGELAVAFLLARKAGFYRDRQDFWNSRMGLPWIDDITKLTVEKFAEFELDYQRGEMPEFLPGERESGNRFAPDLLIVGADVQTWGIPWVVEVFRWDGMHCTIDHGIAATFNDLRAIQTDYAKKRYAPKSFVIVDISFAARRTETLEAIRRNINAGWVAAEGYEILKDLVTKERANVYIGGKKQALNVSVPKLMISTYHFKVELEKKYGGVVRNWFTYQLPLVADTTEAREQAGFYAQLLDERRQPRKHKLVGKPPDEFVSKNNNNHFNDCKVYGLALFFYLSKAQSALAKKKRKTVKAKRA